MGREVKYFLRRVTKELENVITIIMTVEVCPMPSAKKRAASKKKGASKKQKQTKHQKIVDKKRKERAGMTIAQCITFAIRKSGNKKGLVFKQIRTCLKRSGINMSNFIVKNVLKKMLKWGVVKRTNRRYKLTGKRCPSHLKNKHVNKKRRVPKAQRKADAKFKNKMARAAKKMARGGRTIEHCVHDALKVRKNKTLNEIHVMQRLRAKKVVKIYQFRYKNTGNKFPAKKRAA